MFANSKLKPFILIIIGIILTSSSSQGSFKSSIKNFAHSFWSFDAPVPLYPEDNARFTSGDSVLIIEFTDTEDAIGYEIDFAFSDEFSPSYPIELSENHFDFGMYLDQQEWDALSFRFFWRVRAFDGEIYSDWSDVRVFSKSQYPAPKIRRPGKDARFNNMDSMPILEWDANENANNLFEIEFASDEAFNTIYGSLEWYQSVFDFSEVIDREIWNSVSGLFYWRVCHYEDGEIPSPYSSGSYFYKTIHAKPALRTPMNHERYPTVASAPILKWDPIENASDYHLQLITGNNIFPDGLEYFEIDSPQFDFTDYGITPQIWNNFFGQLKWRVSATVSNMHGSFSEDFEFVKIANLRFMAYGDSITGGYGASDWNSGFAGYPPMLQYTLKNRYGSQAAVLCEEHYSWFGGGHAYMGDWYAQDALIHHAPSHVMIMFGTVDAIDTGAPGCENHNCHVKEHLENIIQQVKAFNAIPYLATLPPVNPESERAFVQNDIDMLNLGIRDLALEMNVPLADLEAAFYAAPYELPIYYYEGDWAHFNDLGYEIIANEWANIL